MNIVAHILITLFLVPVAWGQAPSVRHTYPQPRPVKPTDPLSVSPGIQVPDNQDKYTFVTQASKHMGTDEIHVFYIDNSNRRSRIGTIPAGTEVKMTSIAALGRSLYYSIPWKADGTGPKIAWISGFNIKASAFNPAVK